MQTRTLTGDALHRALPDLARLRIAVFREFPYLYDGSADSEENYLAGFAESKDSFIVVAEDAGRIVGCATGFALSGNKLFALAFKEANLDVPDVFYFGESVLLLDYRGRRIGHAFFDAREAHARECGYRTATFCSVARAADHPQRPVNYSPLDGFWRKRGYEKVKGLTATLSWKEVGRLGETAHPMQFWMRDLL